MGSKQTKQTRRAGRRQQLAIERRSNPRFPLLLEVTCRPLRGEHLGETTSGKTLNISRNGLAFICEYSLRPGLPVELSVDWPVLLNENCALRLLVRGTILRMAGNVAALKIEAYEFRTRKFNPNDVDGGFDRSHFLPGQEPRYAAAG